MGDWDDVFGNDNPEWCGKEDDPGEIWSHLDNTCYQDALEMAKLKEGFYELIIDNHVFSTYEEAANAARELAIKKQSAVKVFINHNKKIYSVYDPEMEDVINSVQMCKIDGGYYPQSPLVSLREKDIIYHENSGNWLFVAHPNGTTEDLERNIRGCIRQVLGFSFNPFDQIERNSIFNFHNRFDELKKSLVVSSIYERSEVLNRSIDVNTLCERDNIFKLASIIAKSHKIKVYVVRLEKIDECGIYSRPRYVMFTEEKLNKLLKKYLEFEEKMDQKRKSRQELKEYKERPETIKLKEK